MDLALLLVRLLLAGVFALAGFAKLADLAGSRKGMAEFGVPAALAGHVRGTRGGSLRWKSEESYFLVWKSRFSLIFAALPRRSRM